MRHDRRSTIRDRHDRRHRRRNEPVVVDRYTVGARINHWITATSLVLLALRGLALFHPSLFFLTGLFGGGQMTRAIHPWIGVVLFFGFVGLFLRFWRLNLWEREDSVWMASVRDVLAGHEEKLPEVGKYNAGQKIVFWSMSMLIVVLIAQRRGHLGPVFRRVHHGRAEADRRARARARGDRRDLRLDRPRLCGDLGARHHPRHDARHGHRRLGLAPSPPWLRELVTGKKDDGRTRSAPAE